MENFIYTFQIQDTSVCDDLIEYHKKNTEFKDFGYSGAGPHGAKIDNSVKESVDVFVQPYSKHPTIKKYFEEEIKKGVLDYKQKYEFCDMPFQIKEPMNIQYYPPGGGFKQWHYERNSYVHDELSRVLVYMTYLNDVDNAGTEWLYQNFKTEAKKGLSVIWPAEWTHTHKGIVSESQEKYIATGWLNMKLRMETR